jgi:hypothetical protein
MAAEILVLPIDTNLSLEWARLRRVAADADVIDLAPGLLGLLDGSDGREELTL